MKTSIKTLLIIAIMAITAIGAMAQEVDIGGSLQYSFAPQNLKHNVGADIIVARDLCHDFQLRAIAEVNGFIPNGFDRAGRATLGVAYSITPLYVFADMGACLNPSDKRRLGYTVDAGLGWHRRIGRGTLFTEAALTATHGSKWQNNAIVRAGYLFNIKRKQP